MILDIDKTHIKKLIKMLREDIQITKTFMPEIKKQCSDLMKEHIQNQEIIKILRNSLKKKKTEYDKSGHIKCKHREVSTDPFSKDFCIKKNEYCLHNKCNQ